MRVCGKNVFNELDKTKIKKVYAKEKKYGIIILTIFLCY